jgi:hypothetical protein
MVVGVAPLDYDYDGTLTDVTGKAGLAGAGYGIGVALGGYNVSVRPNHLYAQ